MRGGEFVYLTVFQRINNDIFEMNIQYLTEPGLVVIEEFILMEEDPNLLGTEIVSFAPTSQLNETRQFI